MKPTEKQSNGSLERDVRPTCQECGSNNRPLKRGWTMASYCSAQCERAAVARLHESMPGGPSPYIGWMPHHINLEIVNRWKCA